MVLFFVIIRDSRDGGMALRHREPVVVAENPNSIPNSQTPVILVPGIRRHKARRDTQPKHPDTIKTTTNKAIEALGGENAEILKRSEGEQQCWLETRYKPLTFLALGPL